MSALDVVLHDLDLDDYTASFLSEASAELQRLRAAASEAAALRAELDKWRTWKPDDEDLRSLAQQAMKRDGAHSESLAACWSYIRGLEAWLREHDALRAERDELKSALELGQVNCDAEYDDLRQQLSNECLIAVKLRATVAEQARQIEMAREIFVVLIDMQKYTGKQLLDTWDRADAWLVANAPTPAPEAGSMPRFATAQKYREALEQIERVWVDESIADEHIAALKMYTTAARVLNNADDETDSAPEAEQERTA